MTLPFPHGEASGDIGHNASIDKTDTPGSTGGRFIGFGEEGTSAIANRAHWALSANIDHCHDSLERDIAIRAGETFTSSGQTSRQITGDVFVGDTTYPTGSPADIQVGLNLLFSVLDESYNELTDPATGEPVMVKEVRDSSNVSDVYRTDFATDPYVHFKTATQDPYTIPAAQEVVILHGIKSSLEDLPVDALTKFTVQSAEEIEAGVLLQNGTRPMLANLDMDDNSLNNVDEVNGGAGVPLLIYGNGDLELTSDSDMKLQDQYLSSPLLLSRSGATGTPFQLTDNAGAIVPGINSSYWMHRAFGANRTIAAAGSIAWNGGAGTIDIPTTEVCLNGEYGLVGETGYSPNYSNTLAVLVVDEDGNINDLDPTVDGLAGTEIIIGYFYYNSGGSSFDLAVDLRRKTYHHNDVHEVTVGQNAEWQGADFLSFNAAVTYLQAIQAMITGGNGCVAQRRFRIRVLGTVNVNESFDLSSFSELEIIGDGKARSKIRVTNPGTGNYHLFSCGQCKVIVSDISIEWNYATDQTTNYAAFHRPGNYSIFDNVDFTNGATATNGWANAIMWDTASHDHFTIKRCTAEVSVSFVRGSDLGSTQDWASNVTVEDCLVATNGSSYPAILLPGFANTVRRVDIGAGFARAVLIGNHGVVEDCILRADASDSCVQVFPPVGLTGAFQAVIRNNRFQAGMRGIVVDNNGIVAIPYITMESNLFLNIDMPIWINCDSSVNEADSNYNILNNKFVSCGAASQWQIWAQAYAGRINIRGNVFREVTGGGIAIQDALETKISENHIEGYTGATTSALYVFTTGGVAWITDNYFGSQGADQATSIVQLLSGAEGTMFARNHLDASTGSLQVNAGLSCAAPSAKIVDNYIYKVQEFGIISTASRQVIRGNTITDNNNDLGDSISVSGDDVIIESNIIHGEGTSNAGTLCPIYVSGHRPTIRGNHILAMRGWHTGSISGGAYYIIYVNNAAADPVIEGNVIQECGNVGAGTGTNRTIYSTSRATITGNLIKDPENDGTAGESIYLIEALYGGVISNNHLRWDMSATGNGAVYGIRGHSNNVITGNYIDFRSTYGGSAQAYGIWSDSDHVVCNGNHCNGPGGSGNAGVRLEGDGCVAVGNVMEANTRFEMPSAVSGHAVGNVIIDATLTPTISGTVTPSTGQYSINTSNPQQDFNRNIQP